MINRMVLNETTYFGRGSRIKITDELLDKHIYKPLVITDKVLLDNGIVDMVLKCITNENIEVLVYSDVVPNPTVKQIKEALMFANVNKVDGIIAIGGGSVIDTAKAVGLVMNNLEFADIISLEGNYKTNNKSLPIITFPTTSTSSSEVTINYIIKDPIKSRKIICIDNHNIPITTIIDADLYDFLPSNKFAVSGICSISHAIEGYINKKGWLIPDIFNMNAISLIYKNIYSACIKHDKSSIEKVAYGSYLAGMGFSNVGLGLTHVLSNVISAFYDVSYASVSSIVLIEVLEYNYKICPELFNNISKSINNNDSNLIDILKDLINKLNIPTKLRELGIVLDNFESIADEVIKDNNLSLNPRDVTKDDIINILKQVY